MMISKYKLNSFHLRKPMKLVNLGSFVMDNPGISHNEHNSDEGSG